MNDILEQAYIDLDDLKRLREEESITLEYYETKLRHANNSATIQSLENRIDRKKEDLEELEVAIKTLVNYILEFNNK